MNKNLDFVYAIKKWAEKPSEDGEADSASKLKVPFICHFMPLRWSYESVIISQAKLNPLSRSQQLLEDRIQKLISLPKEQKLTEAQRTELDLTKQALAVVSGLQDEDAGGVVRKLDMIRRGMKDGTLNTATLTEKSSKGVSAEEIFVNRKVLDLVTKAEMEREDYRRKSSPNVFFGTVKTYSGWKFTTLWINIVVMLLMLALTIGALLMSLRRQLSKV
jgi:hypothetical protein